MKEDFKKFIKEKRNKVMLIIIGVTIVLWLLSMLVEVLTPFSCMMTGVLCLDIAYVLFFKYVKLKNSKIDEFMQEEKDLKSKANKFLRSESKVNLILLIVMCIIMGLILIYSGFKMFIV